VRKSPHVYKARSRQRSLSRVSLDRFAMHALMLSLIAAASVGALSSCASRADLAVKRVDSAVHAYREAYPRKAYPHTLKELAAFAQSQGRPLDLTPFSKVTLERESSTFMSITFESRDRLSAYRAIVYSDVY
jgi:hypothetical protein